MAGMTEDERFKARGVDPRTVRVVREAKPAKPANSRKAALPAPRVGKQGKG